MRIGGHNTAPGRVKTAGRYASFRRSYMNESTLSVDDPRVKAADMQLVVLDDWLDVLVSLRSKHAFQQDVWLANSFLKSLRRGYLHMRKGWQTDSSYAAWGCRSLLELSVFAEYVTTSSDNKRRFIQDFAIDNDQSTGALIAIANSLPLSEYDVQGARKAADALKAAMGVTVEKYLQTSDLAKDMGRERDVSISKLCSKLIHPTAQSILGCGMEISGERDTLFLLGARYFIEAMGELAPFIEKLR